MTALTNAQRQTRYREKHRVPRIYDHDRDLWREVTQEDVDTLLKRLGEAVLLRNGLLEALGLPLNAKEQIAKLASLGGFYGAKRDETFDA